MADNDSGDGEVSSAQAVLLGALAPGVNGPTWTTLKSAFLMLGLCLVLMLALAFSSSDSWLILHVTFLVVSFSDWPGFSEESNGRTAVGAKESR
uniref:Uncharacterized protein n=1 Tax=Cucumis melo TaxID=3656 RepID=A0A9I9CF17_CUCME